MAQRILIDSSGLIAFMDRRSSAHAAVATIIDTPTNNIIIPASAIPETSYIVSSRLGHAALRLFIQDIAVNSPAIENLSTDDYKRIAAVLQEYADLRLDFVDASIMAIAERLNVQHILTLDRRDFRVLRPQHCAYFELLP